MNNVEKLELLYESYKKKSKLNAEEKQEVVNILENALITNSENIMEFDYIIRFPEELGAKCFIKCLMKASEGRKKQLLNQLRNNKVFNNNINGMGTARGSYIIGELYKNNNFCGIQKLLIQVINFSVNKKNKISDKNIEYFRKNIVDNYYEKLFGIKFFNIDDKTYEKIKNAMVNIIFQKVNNKACSTRIQLGCLKWLSMGPHKTNLDKNQLTLINDTIKLWPKEILNIAREDEKLNLAYNSKLNFELSIKDISELSFNEGEKSISDSNNAFEKKELSGEKITIKLENESNGDCINDKKSKEENQEKFDVLSMLKNSIAEVQLIMKNEKALENKIIQLKDTNNSIQKNYETKLNENERLYNRVEQLKSENGQLTLRNELLNKQINDLNVANKELLNEKEKSENKVSDLLDIRKSEGDEALSEFKVKLGAKLKMLYKDFKETEELEMSEDFGENLRIQMNEIFKILIKCGINL